MLSIRPGVLDKEEEISGIGDPTPWGSPKHPLGF